MPKNAGHTVRSSAEALEARRSRGDDKTDWTRVDAMSDADLEVAIASDPDEAGMIVDWSNAKLSLRPSKKTMTIRLDADVLAFFKAMGRGYQTRMNAVLRSFMEHSQR